MQNTIHQHDLQQILISTMAGEKVSRYVALANKSLSDLALRTEESCSNIKSQDMDCLDDFCDQVPRLARQIALRTSLDGAFERLHLDSVHDFRHDSEANASVSIAQVAAPDGVSSPSQARLPSSYALSVWQREYEHATQDFWRQVVSILRDLLNIRKHYQTITLTRLVILFIVTFMFALGLGVFLTMTFPKSRGVMLISMGLLLIPEAVLFRLLCAWLFFRCNFSSYWELLDSRRCRHRIASHLFAGRNSIV